MEDRARFEALRDPGDIPDELPGSPELIALSAPAMRAELRLFETYQSAELPLDDVLIYAYYGRDDDNVEKEFAAWSRETTAASHGRAFDRGHMFIHDNVTALGNALITDLMAMDMEMERKTA